MSNEMTDNDFFFDASGVSSDEFQESTGRIHLSGFYHVTVKLMLAKLEKVKNGQPATPMFSAFLVVLHSAPGQSSEGSTVWHNLLVGAKTGSEYKANSRNNMLQFLVACGVAKDTGDGIVDSETDGVLTKSTYERCVNCQLIIAVEMKNNKVTKIIEPTIAFGGCFALDNPKVADTPRNDEAAALFGAGVAPVTNPVDNEDDF